MASTIWPLADTLCDFACRNMRLVLKCFLSSSRNKPLVCINRDLYMVSCDTHICFPSHDVFFNEPAICSGDQSASSSRATSERKATFSPKCKGFGRLLRLRNAFSARAALYRSKPPFRDTSREMVDGLRSNSRLMLRRLCPLAIPRDIVSRSSNVRNSERRTLALG